MHFIEMVRFQDCHWVASIDFLCMLAVVMFCFVMFLNCSCCSLNEIENNLRCNKIVLVCLFRPLLLFHSKSLFNVWVNMVFFFYIRILKVRWCFLFVSVSKQTQNQTKNSHTKHASLLLFDRIGVDILTWKRDLLLLRAY